MLYSEIVAVCSEIYTKHTNNLCVQEVGFLIVEVVGTYNSHWRLWG